MSQSPVEALRVQRYEDGWEIINRLIREDFSWGGYERKCFHVACDDGTFADISSASGADFLDDGRAYAVIDADRDGRPDLVLRGRTSPQLRVLRNVWPEPGAAVWFRLEGVTSNRDAIGARITIATRAGRRVKEVAAGSLFLSQMARWVPFGLGRDPGPVTAEVRWPSGRVQGLGLLDPDRRYRVREGEPPVAEPFAARDREPGSLAGSAAAAPAGERETVAREGSGTWLLTPMPAPDFALADVREPGGKRHGPGTYRGKPLFLHFASPACGVCNAEGEAVRRAEKLVAERGARFLHVIADPDGDGAAARAFAERLRFGAPAVRADERVVLAYNLIHKHLWNRRRNLGVPTTFLLDEDGAVVKAYRGQAGPEEMARDLERLPRTPEARRELALPFPGRLLKHAFARDPLGLGNAYYEAGLHDLASAVFAGGSAANDADTLFNYALASAQGGRTAEAEAAYRRVLELAPALDEARNNLGTLLARAGRVAEAREVFREIVTRNPAHAEAVLNLGNALLAEDRIAEVAETYRRALVHDPESAAFHRQLGYALYRLGDREAAIGEYTRAAAIDPLDHEATLGLAIVLLATGRAAEAKQAAESGLEREPSHAHLLNARAMACAGLGESREAIAALEKAIAADPAFDRPYLNLARLLADEGRREEAAAVLRRLLAAVPGHEPGRQLLAEVE